MKKKKFLLLFLFLLAHTLYASESSSSSSASSGLTYYEFLHSRIGSSSAKVSMPIIGGWEKDKREKFLVATGMTLVGITFSVIAYKNCGKEDRVTPTLVSLTFALGAGTFWYQFGK